MIAEDYIVEELDYEWKELMIQAKELGISIEEIRQFLKATLKKTMVNK